MNTKLICTVNMVLKVAFKLVEVKVTVGVYELHTEAKLKDLTFQ